MKRGHLADIGRRRWVRANADPSLVPKLRLENTRPAKLCFAVHETEFQSFTVLSSNSDDEFPEREYAKGAQHHSPGSAAEPRHPGEWEGNRGSNPVRVPQRGHPVFASLLVKSRLFNPFRVGHSFVGHPRVRSLRSRPWASLLNAFSVKHIRHTMLDTQTGNNRVWERGSFRESRLGGSLARPFREQPHYGCNWTGVSFWTMIRSDRSRCSWVRRPITPTDCPRWASRLTPRSACR